MKKGKYGFSDEDSVSVSEKNLCKIVICGSICASEISWAWYRAFLSTFYKISLEKE